MHHSAVLVSDQESSAGVEGREFVHEVVEEDLFERIATEFGQCIDLCHKILVFKFCAGVELHSVVESFRHREEIDELHEAGQGMHEVTDYGCPSDHGWIVERNLVN